MIQFLKKYKAFIFGFIIIIPIFNLLGYLDLLIIPEEKTYEIVIYTIIWGFIIGLPIYYFENIKKKRDSVLIVLGLVAVFVVTIIIDNKMQTPDNPITLALISSFWIGFVYLIVPKFIRKYWKLIVLIYVPLFAYFTYLRLFSGGLDAYLEIKQEFPFFLFFLPIPVLFVLWFYEQWKWLQNLKSEKAKAELAMLQAQINPHFFFNTLNNLYALTIKHSEKAPEVILKLSDMMRYTIYEGKKDLVPLKDEIQYISNYIDLHSIRYKKFVQISFNQNVDDNIKVAPLLFIILVENAFKHGVDSLSENAFITINLNTIEDQLEFILENNFDPNETSESKGIGLSNLKHRLDLLYRKNYTLTEQVKDSNIYNVRLKIPFDA